MPVVYPAWQPEMSDVTSTILTLTLTSRVRAAPSATPAAEKMSSRIESMTSLFAGPDGIFWTLILLYAILSLVSLVQSRRELSEGEEMERAVDDDWDLPWQTKDWMTLYGLIGMAYEDETMYTPFRRQYIRSIQQRYQLPTRSQLRMLLETGIIPLFIQDGGISTEQRRHWCWSSTFPFIKLSRFEQAKRRACFEFLIPRPERPEVARFFKILGYNQWRYGVQMRTCNQIHNRETVDAWEEPAGPYDNTSFPLSIGAESTLEPMLPILPDKPLDMARSDTINGLEWYVKDNITRTLPLLHFWDVCIFRVEAGHWGPAELDSFILGCAEKAGLNYRWPVDVARRKAIKELERRGLATKVD
ncbi:hypothetical protein GMOD_00009996 [Pyrenophora seminiperda CCB06]|uniref:Uncharacterized protein n=1 Tax=Pyrenophora seminiperda CCB06 TaxID=1302712 RepID=A0A3M7M1L4_9PLEO|nr:hypothetical protein GMOD_00009996 [Pyrenophora seminiperda CCB06]